MHGFRTPDLRNGLHVLNLLEYFHGRDRCLEPEQRIQLIDETLEGLAVLRHGVFSL
jgi:hypothetical protein